MKLKYMLLFFSLGVLVVACTDTKPKKTSELTEKIKVVVPPSKKQTKKYNTVEGFFENYENTNRVIWQKPELVIDLFGNLSDKVIADVGTGSGYFALRLAKKSKRVIAIDIDKKYLNYIDSVKNKELPESVGTRVETRLGTEDDPNLSDGELDAAVISNTYMYISNRVDYLKKLKAGLNQNGRVLIIDFKRKKTPIGPPPKFRIPLYQVELELEEAGFRNITTNDCMLDYQYVIIAEK